jgi:uncharacterized protein DUF4331
MRTRKIFKFSLIFLLGLLFTVNGILYRNIANAASHREAPITALDHTADITDWFTFNSYDPAAPNTVTMILNVDPFLEPSNGPNYFPFDPEIEYRMNVDNNLDGEEEIRFVFRFTTNIQIPNLFTGFAGDGNGINAPANAPTDINGNSTVGAAIIPPAITSLKFASSGDPGAQGISLIQTYTVTETDGSGKVICGPISTDVNGNPLIAVPSNVGPRTMPNYAALAEQGIFKLGGCLSGSRVFVGTVDDPFYIDLGAAFDTLNLRVAVLSAQQDANDTQNVGNARDDVSGFNVNSIALEVPITTLTSDHQLHPATDTQAVIGTYGSTLRSTTRTFGQPIPQGATLQQIQRMGNALINELIIGTGFKDKFSMSEPKDDAQFANFFLDPVLAHALNAAFGINVPNPPRLDLATLVTYAPPICPACPLTNGLGVGPVSDLLRLNTGIPATLPNQQKRIGFLAGDNAGYPNGRRVFDDVTDISLRAVAGVLAGSQFNVSPNNLLGDGINHNDRGENTQNDLGGGTLNAIGYQDVFPYEAFAHSGRDTRHIDANEPETLGGGSSSSGGGCAIARAETNMGIAGMAGVAVMLIVPVLFVLGRRLTRKAKKAD